MHFLVVGFWPPSEALDKVLLFLRHFSSGYAAILPELRITYLAILGCAGYVVVRALARILGRDGPRPDASSAALAGMLLAWAPYYVNRPSDGNMWTSLCLFGLLIAPAVARSHARSTKLFVVAVLLLIPIPLGAVKTDMDYFRAASNRVVVPGCAAGLSLAPDDCVAHRARAAALIRIAAPGDVVWMTAYPFITLRMTGLRPPVTVLDVFFAGPTESELDTIVAEINAARPIALLLDGATSSTGAMVHSLLRSHQARIAARADFAPCPIVPAGPWEVWLPKGTCQANDPRVRALISR
jgi:hypothetical protein